MDQIWIDMYNAAKAVLGGVTISDYVTAGEVKVGKDIRWSMHRYLFHAWDMRREKCHIQYDHKR